MMSRNQSKLSPSDLLAHKTAEENVRRLGAHKAINRGIFDRYTSESVLNAASNSQSKIDKTMAEMMSSETKELMNPDLVMVPSSQSTTGWKYVKK